MRNSRKNKSEEKTLIYKSALSTVRLAHSIVNLTVIAAVLLLLVFGCYSMWDSEQVLSLSDSKRYEVYKPGEKENNYSFKELEALNPDVFAWLTVFGTHIDYPVVHTSNNDVYINTDVFGSFSMGGALFLDYENSKDFDDFNSIIYGHHMEKNAMFGELSSFMEKDFFEARKYGDLFFDGEHHGIEFFAFLEADAYDNNIYKIGINDPAKRENYIAYLLENATNKRDIELSADSQLIVLSTCTSNSTNGRHLLIGKLTDNVFSDPFPNNSEEEGYIVNPVNSIIKSLSERLTEIPYWGYILAALILLILLTVLDLLLLKRKGKKEPEKKTLDERCEKQLEK